MPGFTLHDRFNVCRLVGMPGIPRAELLGYMLETAEALDRLNLHHRVQHLDVKPQNLILDFGHIRVADFEFAQLLEGVRATVTGGVTPVYAAPETFEGWISPSTDQYSLACVYQEMLTGVRPLPGKNTRELLMQHLNGTPNLTPLPESDQPVVRRALSKNPDDRYPSCVAFVRELMGGSDSPLIVEPPPSLRNRLFGSGDAKT